ncbi:MAG: hypothetical protein AVDCRST_MAG60-1977, partial [uncultured Nocardioides sp.]
PSRPSEPRSSSTGTKRSCRWWSTSSTRTDQCLSRTAVAPPYAPD